MFVFDILPCMCLAALWPPFGNMAKVVVPGPAGPESLDPLFWPSIFSAVSLFSPFGLFFFDVTIPNVAHVINRPCQGVKTSSHRNMGYGSRREKTYGNCISTTKAQTLISDCCSISGKYN